MGVKVDKSHRSAVAYCTDCPSWREVHLTRRDALTAGAYHEDHCHGDTAAAAKLIDRARTLKGR